MRRSLPLAMAVAACGGGGGGGGAPDAALDPYRDPTAIEARLRTTLDDLAALGDKRAGSPAGEAAGDLVHARLIAAGLGEVHFERFEFPSFELDHSSLAVTLDGAPLVLDHDVFYYSGSGTVSADLVDVGLGHPSVYDAVDVTDKICLVTRDATYHRSSQYRECAAHGGAAMLYISQAPENLIQVGTVTVTPELGPIPVVTIGADDGQTIKDAVARGDSAIATIEVNAAIVAASGRNVVGALPGSDPSGAYLLIGAHYDSWGVGAADNGTGTAALIEVAEALARDDERRFGIVFVGYDGEELGLFGGYDYLRDHLAVAGEPMLAFFNFEMPATGAADARALGHTNHPALDDALQGAALRYLYPLYVGMQAVPELFGGVIPTDIQGMYWAGVAGFSTACDSPYYHTAADTPDRLDVGFLAQTVLAFADAATAFDALEAADLATRDPELWSLAVTTLADGDDLAVTVTVTDDGGGARDMAAIGLFVEVDDFTRAHTAQATTDADGRAVLSVPAAALAAGAGSRWLHVTAGDSYPLVEHVLALP